LNTAQKLLEYFAKFSRWRAEIDRESRRLKRVLTANDRCAIEAAIAKRNRTNAHRLAHRAAAHA
jgi:hypothetical protein